MDNRGQTRLWRVALAFALVVGPFNGVMADDRTSFIIDMTHASYAKVYCPGLEVVYDGFVAAAQAKKLNPEIVEEVRNGVAYLNTNGQMGQKPRKDVMDTITLAAKMVALQHVPTGVNRDSQRTPKERV
jgi:hypothetical protein